MKAGFLTYGCKVNQYETQAMRELLEQTGIPCASEDETPDIFIINSCTVTAESDRKTRQAVRRARREYPGAIIVLTGCMPQAFPEESSALEEADIVLGNRDPGRLLEAIFTYGKTGARVVEITPHQRDESFSGGNISNFHERTRAYLQIQNGCDRYCSYCIIPTARGPVRSKPLSDIRGEVAALSGHFREIVLVGINLTSYGRDLGLTLPDAVAAASEPAGITRVRLGSLEPDRLPPETVERLAGFEKLCPHFHLSLQSGSDGTLCRMNRHYTAVEYREICESLRAKFPGAAITTDVMVGFPGETEEEFAESLEFVRSIGFARVHVFAFSRRPGTAAARMPEQIPNRIKQERARRMAQAAEESAAQFLNGMVGSTVEVLMESSGGGYTSNYTYVRLAGSENDKNAPAGESESVIGSLIRVRITGTDESGAVGVPV